jgi:hypothetical protein
MMALVQEVVELVVNWIVSEEKKQISIPIQSNILKVQINRTYIGDRLRLE